MIEIKINKENLLLFLNDIRKEDEEELIEVYGKKYKQKFISICLKIGKYIYFVADKNFKPIAIGGLVERRIKNVKCGQVWLLTTNNVQKNKISLAKYISTKIKYFKANFDFLFNYIYQSNYGSISWIKKFDFIFLKCAKEHYQLFYFKNGGINFDL